jgi:hypothetical protein
MTVEERDTSDLVPSRLLVMDWISKVVNSLDWINPCAVQKPARFKKETLTSEVIFAGFDGGPIMEDRFVTGGEEQEDSNDNVLTYRLYIFLLFFRSHCACISVMAKPVPRCRREKRK